MLLPSRALSIQWLLAVNHTEDEVRMKVHVPQLTRKMLGIASDHLWSPPHHLTPHKLERSFKILKNGSTEEETKLLQLGVRGPGGKRDLQVPRY